jgi:hypothetical protein
VALAVAVMARAEAVAVAVAVGVAVAVAAAVTAIASAVALARTVAAAAEAVTVAVTASVAVNGCGYGWHTCQGHLGYNGVTLVTARYVTMALYSQERTQATCVSTSHPENESSKIETNRICYIYICIYI